MFLRVRRDVRHTAAVTMPEVETCGADAVAAGEIELLAQEAAARWSGSFAIEPRTFVAYLSARLAPGAQSAEAMRGNAADL